MRQATTPILAITISTDVALERVVKVLLTISNIRGALNFDIHPSEIDIENRKLLVHLTQEQTTLISGESDIQLRLMLDDDNVYASDIKTLSVGRVLNSETLKA